MTTLLTKLQKAGSIKHAEILSESSFFNLTDPVKTDLPILNIAFSGEVDGGLVPGITIIAGESKAFKTLLGLYCLKAYMNQYPESICLFYNNEFGVTPKYLEMFNIDTSRILHIPIEHVEQLKFDLVKRLEEIEKGDKVFVLVDSLGTLASKKEIDDAIDEKSVADMTRAKAIRSLLRIVTPHFTMKELPCIIINHVYQEQGLFPKTVIPGGKMVTFAANQIFVITKRQIKDGKDITGYTFVINIDKSRYVREKSAFPFDATYEDGVDRYSGLLSIALDAGLIANPTKGWYSVVDPTTGEVDEKKYRASELDASVWEPILASEAFHEHVRTRYQLTAPVVPTMEEVEEFIGDAA